MRTNRFGRAALVVGGAALVLVMAGCSDLGGTSKAADPQVPTVEPSNTAPTSATDTPPPTTPTSAPPSSSTSSQPQQGQDSGACQTTDLRLSLGVGDGATGTLYRPLQFTNVGGRTCVIQGFPGVSYVTGDDGHQVGQPAFREGSKGPAITLTPGMTVFADVGFVQAGNFDPADCQPTAVRGLRVYPPHEYDSMFVAAEGTGCAGNPPSYQLTVRTVQPGSGPGA